MAITTKSRMILYSFRQSHGIFKMTVEIPENL